MNASAEGPAPARLRVLLCDDEPLARMRLRSLLADCHAVPTEVVAEVGDAVAAMQALTHLAVDVALLDIHLPGLSGLGLAAALRELAQPPAVIFVSAHAEHALDAFACDALDYLTKPVRLERLAQALQKAKLLTQARRAKQPEIKDDFVTLQARGRLERVPLAEVIYFKAELKYLTLRTAAHSFILEGSLGDWQARLGERFLRIHRNALVARAALRGLSRGQDDAEGEVWLAHLAGVDEALAVSRRQLPLVRAALGG